jgi:hypothetical protein
MSIDETPRMLLTSPADLLSAVPYLLGFHPVDSLVVAGFTGRPPDGRLRLTTRWDLPAVAGALRRLPPLLGREGVTQAMLVGFGAGPLVTPAVDEANRLLREAGIEVTEALRVEGGRYWSYLCRNVRCCPPEGVPYDPVAGPATGARERSKALRSGRATMPWTVACTATGPATGSYGTPSGGQQRTLRHRYDQ